MIGTVLCYVLLPAARLLRALRGNPAPGGRRRGPAGAGCGSPSPPPAPARGGCGRRGPGGGEPGSCRLPRRPPESLALGGGGGALVGGLRLLPELAWAGAAPPRGSAGGWVFGGNSRRLLCRSGRLRPAGGPEPPAPGLRCRSREVFGDGLLLGPLLPKDLRVARGWTLALGASLFHLAS